MRRALRGAVGVLLAVAAVVPAPKASAKLPFLRRRSQQPPPVETVVYEENTVLSEGHNRLEEMKVELALLSNIATFPYYLGTRSAGEILTLRGYVPNDMVRQRALEIARRNTFLTVQDGLRIQSNLSLRPPLRPARVLQQDGAMLLQEKLGEPAKKMSLGVRPNGLVVVSGPVDSVEGKLAVSRLFRQLSGCSGVINEMTIQQVLRDGQFVVQVTRDGSMVVPPSALGLQPGQSVLSHSAPAPSVPAMPAPSLVMPAPTPETAQPVKVPKKQSSKPAIALPSILPSPPRSTQSMNTLKDDLRLPTIMIPKPATTRPKTEPKKSSSASDTPTPAKLPVKWGQPAMSWESQVKKLEPINATPIPPSPRVSTEDAKAPKEASPLPRAVPTKSAPDKRRASDSLAAPKQPVKWGTPAAKFESQVKKSKPKKALPTPVAPRVAKEEAKMPTPIAPRRPVETKKAHASSAESKPGKARKKPLSSFAGKRMARTPAMTWQRPASEEESESKTQPVSKPKEALPSVSAKSKPARSVPPPTSSSRRWPPAYEPESSGRPGLIIFDDDPPPSSTPGAAAIGTSRPIVPANLQRQVQSVCGRKAREVVVERQPDGTVLVKVTVPNLSVEARLTRKILAIPEMTSPKVQLLMDVER